MTRLLLWSQKALPGDAKQAKPTLKKPKKHFLIFLDILGFKELVRNRSAEEVYTTLDRALKYAAALSRGGWKTFYFSDSIIVFQPCSSARDYTLAGPILSVASLMVSTLWAQRIPCSAAIAHGDFVAEIDTHGAHQVFFGEALIEAYETVQREKWLGLVGCTSFQRCVRALNIEFMTQQALIGHDEGLKKSGFGIMRDSVFLANALYGISLKCRGPKRELPQSFEVNALRFLVDQSARYAGAGDFSGPVAIRYHATMHFLKECIGDDTISWVLSEGAKNEVQ